MRRLPQAASRASAGAARLWRRAIEPVQQAHSQPAGEHDRACQCDPVEMGADAERAAADVVGLQADDGQRKKHRDDCGEQSVLGERDPEDRRVGDFVDGEPGGSRHQTFSTSGRPSRPVGQKTSTNTSTTKTETSLYSTEK